MPRQLPTRRPSQAPRYPNWKQSRRAAVAGLGALLLGSACGVSEPYEERSPEPMRVTQLPPAGPDASQVPPRPPGPDAAMPPDAGMPPDAAEMIMGDAPGPEWYPDAGVK